VTKMYFIVSMGASHNPGQYLSFLNKELHDPFAFVSDASTWRNTNGHNERSVMFYRGTIVISIAHCDPLM
jgi:hypothetical protein